MFEQVPRSLKVIALVVLIGVLVFVLLLQRGYIGQKASVATPEGNASQTATTKQAKVEPVPVEKVQEKTGSLQDQINQGTISPQEALKQMDALNAQIEASKTKK